MSATASSTSTEPQAPPAVIQLEERQPLVPTSIRERIRARVSGASEAAGSRPPSAAGSSSGVSRVSQAHVHAERDRAHPYRRIQSPEDSRYSGVKHSPAQRVSVDTHLRFSPHEASGSPRSDVGGSGSVGTVVTGGGAASGIAGPSGSSRMRYAANPSAAIFPYSILSYIFRISHYCLDQTLSSFFLLLVYLLV
jgi:hypothetical protein